MPTIIDIFDYVSALKQQVQQRDIQIQQLQTELEILKKGKK
jgi:conjugal transfer/entry exclusion protein